MKLWKLTLTVLVLIFLLLVFALRQMPDGNLHIIVCDVGQGDAILTIHKNIQILTDGGPDDRVENCLGKYLPFWDREIEVIVSTHPDSDHSTGLVGVLKRYKVGSIMITPVDPGTQVYKALENEVGGRGVRVINPERGMTLGVGMIYLDILNPHGGDLGLRETKSNPSTNELSVVYILKYGRFKALFAGDIPSPVSDRIAAENPATDVNYIKIPHHGSANGPTDNLLNAFMPEIAVISVGAINQWGFPNPKVLELLSKYNVRVFRTDEGGDIYISTDGEKIWKEN